MVDFSNLLGVTLIKIERDGDEKLTFHSADNKWVMYHGQDCCETVEITEIIGDLDDLLNEPILLAEEVTSDGDAPDDAGTPPDRYLDDSHTWTFYKLRTRSGDVTIRWLGTSNGYYSEGVYFGETRP